MTKKRKLNHFFTVFAFYCFTANGHACEAKINTLGCDFYVSNANSDCSSFTFTYCTYQTYSNIANKGSFDSQTPANHYNWSSCLQNCCQTSAAPQTYQTLKNCQSKNQNAAIIIGEIIGGSVLLSSLLLILCCCLKEKIKNCYFSLNRKCCKCLKKKVETQEVGWHDFSKGCEEKEPKTSTILCQNPWVECEQQSCTKVKETNCVICLGEKPSVILGCSHLFHRDCIFEWIRIKRECPLCKSWLFGSLTVMCEVCLSKKREKCVPLEDLLKCKTQLCLQCERSD